MNTIKRLYREYFQLEQHLANTSEIVIQHLLIDGQVAYDNQDWEMLDVIHFLKKYFITSLCPTMGQFYFMHLKYNILDTLASFPDTPIYEISIAFPIWSYAVDLEDTAKFYKKYSTKQFKNNIRLTKK